MGYFNNEHVLYFLTFYYYPRRNGGTINFITIDKFFYFMLFNECKCQIQHKNVKLIKKTV